MDPSKTGPRSSRLAQSAYNSPYGNAGAPTPHPNTDPYAALRAKALKTLEEMGYDPQTMAERGVVWAEDQDPFGHVTQAQFLHFLGMCFHRVMESYDEYLNEEEYNGMILGKTVVPMVGKYELVIRRQVKYPDSLIAAYKQDVMEPTLSNGITSLFSLKQQAIVAEVKGYVAFVDVKTGRSVDIRTLGGGWAKVFEGFTKKAEAAKALDEKWKREHAPKRKPKASKI